MVSSFIINLKQDVVGVDNSSIVPLHKNTEEKTAVLPDSDFEDFTVFIEESDRNVYIQPGVLEESSEDDIVESVVDETENFKSYDYESEELAVVDEETDYVAEEVEIGEFVEKVEAVEEISEVSDPVVNEVIHTPEWSGMNSDIMIIVGSFKAKDNASTLLNELRAKGYQTDTMSGPNGYTRVGVKFNTDHTNISTALRDVRSNVVKDAWLLSSEDYLILK